MTNILLLSVIFILLFLYVDILLRFRHVNGILRGIADYLKLVDESLNEQHKVNQSVFEHIGLFAKCMIDISNTIEHIDKKTCWMDGVDSALGRTLNMNVEDEDGVSI